MSESGAWFATEHCKLDVLGAILVGALVHARGGFAPDVRPALNTKTSSSSLIIHVLTKHSITPGDDHSVLFGAVESCGEELREKGTICIDVVLLLDGVEVSHSTMRILLVEILHVDSVGRVGDDVVEGSRV